MSWLRRLVNTFRPARLHRDIERELSFHIAERADLKLRVVVDVNLEAATRLAAPYGAAASADVTAALAEPEIDAVLIASSSNTHAELVTRAVEILDRIGYSIKTPDEVRAELKLTKHG